MPKPTKSADATLPFENLFYNGVRRLRPRLGGALGAFFRFAGPIYSARRGPAGEQPGAVGRYRTGQLRTVLDIQALTELRGRRKPHRLSHWAHSYGNRSSDGSWSIANHRYLLENIQDELNTAGQWFVDRLSSPWTLSSELFMTALLCCLAVTRRFDQSGSPDCATDGKCSGSLRFCSSR